MATFALKNPNLSPEEDYLYHLGLSPKNDDLVKRFGDVKFVCMGGKPSRMHDFANFMLKKLNYPSNSEFDNAVNNTNHGKVLKDIGKSAGRYSIFKVGPVLSVSHGIGMASLSVAMHEVFKLLHYAKCEKDVVILRLGSSGGLGIKPGTLIITEQPYTEGLETKFSQYSCGNAIQQSCTTTPAVRDSLLECGQQLNIPVTIGNTMAANDFFEAQGRTDGAFCDHSIADKMKFLKRMNTEYKIKNMEMESPCFGAMCQRAGLQCGIICIALLNRFDGDTVSLTSEQIEEWQNQLYQVVYSYVTKTLNGNIGKND